MVTAPEMKMLSALLNCATNAKKCATDVSDTVDSDFLGMLRR